MKLNYWIHGRMAAGKTLLANEIVGPQGITVSARGSTDAGLRRLLQDHKRVVLDEFREDDPASSTVMLAAENGKVSVGSLDGKSVRSIQFDIDVLVVISEEPPRDPALRRLFHVIEITRAGYTPEKDAPAQSFWARLFGGAVSRQNETSPSVDATEMKP